MRGLPQLQERCEGHITFRPLGLVFDTCAVHHARQGNAILENLLWVQVSLLGEVCYGTPLSLKAVLIVLIFLSRFT